MRKCCVDLSIAAIPFVEGVSGPPGAALHVLAAAIIVPVLVRHARS